MGREIELNGSHFSIGRLSAMQQLHVSRRVAPIVPALIPVFVGLRGKESFGDNLEGLAVALQPLADGLAGLKDEDAEYVVGTCLSVVQRRQDTGWARVWALEQKRLMFEDMDMSVILPIVVQVIIANLGPFIQGLLTSQASSPAPAKQAG